MQFRKRYEIDDSHFNTHTQRGIRSAHNVIHNVCLCTVWINHRESAGFWPAVAGNVSEMKYCELWRITHSPWPPWLQIISSICVGLSVGGSSRSVRTWPRNCCVHTLRILDGISKKIGWKLFIVWILSCANFRD